MENKYRKPTEIELTVDRNLRYIEEMRNRRINAVRMVIIKNTLVFTKDGNHKKY